MCIAAHWNYSSKMYLINSAMFRPVSSLLGKVPVQKPIQMISCLIIFNIFYSRVGLFLSKLNTDQNERVARLIYKLWALLTFLTSGFLQFTLFKWVSKWSADEVVDFWTDSPTRFGLLLISLTTAPLVCLLNLIGCPNLSSVWIYFLNIFQYFSQCFSIGNLYYTERNIQSCHGD